MRRSAGHHSSTAAGYRRPTGAGVSLSAGVMAGKKKAKATQASAPQSGGQQKERQANRDICPPPPALTPKRYIPVTTLIPQQLFVIHGFLYQPEAQSIVRTLEQTGLQPTPPPPKAQAAEYAVRRMQRTQFESREYAEALWISGGLANLLDGLDLGVDGELVGLNPSIRGYRYDVGDRFGRHYDGSCDVGSRADRDGDLSTEYTLLIYLGDFELEGGETVFWLPGPEGVPTVKNRKAAGGKGGSKQPGRASSSGPAANADEDLDVPVDGMEELVVKPTPGTLLLHRHGDACLLHEGRTVTRGHKYVLRSDLVFRNTPQS